MRAFEGMPGLLDDPDIVVTLPITTEGMKIAEDVIDDGKGELDVLYSHGLDVERAHQDSGSTGVLAGAVDDGVAHRSEDAVGGRDTPTDSEEEGIPVAVSGLAVVHNPLEIISRYRVDGTVHSALLR